MIKTLPATQALQEAIDLDLSREFQILHPDERVRLQKQAIDDALANGADINSIGSWPNSNKIFYYLLSKGLKIYEPQQALSFYSKKELFESQLENNILTDHVASDGFPISYGYISDLYFRAKIINLSHDPLFALLKTQLNQDNIFSDPNIIHIAVSVSEKLIACPLWGTARRIMNNNPNIKFHLLTLEIAETLGDELLSKFDAFINPGGADSFPIDLKEFTNQECPHLLDLEQIYQFIVKKSFELNTPYFGICSGSQHLALIHGSSLQTVEGYWAARHEVTYIPGTLSHFQLLTKEEQQHALQNCSLPDIKFRVETFNNYAAVANKLGPDLELASSIENIAMAYAHNNGIRYGVQYHPEDHYGNDDHNGMFQTLLFENFIEIAKIYHNHKLFDDSPHPSDYFANVKVRLAECIENPTCWAEEDDLHIVGYVTDQE